MVCGLPLGRRSARGVLRWYLVACQEGSEQSTCDRVRAIVNSELLDDAFVPRRERVHKYQGIWKTHVVQLFPGYFVAATKDAPALSRVLAGLSFSVRIVGAVGRGYQPLSYDVVSFMSQCMDAQHVIRCSEGEIISNRLHVLSGPLKGQEQRVARVARHKATAMVRVGDSDGAEALISVPLSIPVRR